ncbi:centrosomal protein of 120 kDa-like [Anopheles maculipalpis]|uniref:centrosomal protein of 120 kDa-like n=1 Tax=Anopheles maculipalpis TaxID=1496333 RepID=UPI002159A099|nr:centrosomal protein of 120 kDa-like [Anopheles maculipalpis]
MEPTPLHPLHDQQELIIFVQILAGIRFQQEKQGRKIALVASLNQQVFEAVSRRSVTPGSGNASFNAKLIWKCDRHFLKSMKTKNAPIKLDCYEVQPTGARSHVGSVVIPLRSVPVVTLPRIKSLKPRWYRLIGIENERWRRIKPELHLLVMVTDSQYLNQGATGIRDDLSTPDMSEDEQTKRSEPKPERLPSNVELLEDRGLLQVGCKDTDLELFLFEIVLKCAQHLDQFCPGKDAFLLRYELLGDHHVARAERVKPGSAVFSVKSKIRINLRSSVAALIDYFDNGFKILVSVLSAGDGQMLESDRNGKAVGKATVHFVAFLKSKNLEEFKEIYSANNNTLDAVRSVPILAANSMDEHRELKDNMNEKLIIPSIKYKLSLRYLGRDGAILKEVEETTNVDTALKNIEQPEQTTSNYTVAPVTSGSKLDEVLPTHVSKPSTPKSNRIVSDGNREEKVNIDNILMASEQDLRDIRRTFAFRVRVGTVKFTSHPSPGLWQLALQHPKADTPFTKIRLDLLPDIAVHEDRIEFGDVTLELLFSALPDRVLETINAEPSKLTLNGPHGSYALARLDNESLLVGTRERQPAGVVVMINEAGENVAIASISCALKEVGLNYNSQLGNVLDSVDCCHILNETKKGFDEKIAYKLVEEQKAWMEEQRKQFIDQLKQKEDQHLRALAQRWKEQQAEAEKRLSDRLARVDALAAALDEANRNSQPNVVVPQDSARAKLLEQQFRSQLEEIRAKAVRLEQEAKAQIEMTRRQGQQLQQQQLNLSADQQYLIDCNRTLRNDLEQERAARTQLELQLDEMTTSKQYYKEEWARLTRKMHQLQQELSMARTPYFQPLAKNKRTGRPRTAATSSAFPVSTARSDARQGAGDACVMMCHCSKDSDSKDSG